MEYTSTDVTRECPVTLRQLQWWDEQGVLSPVQEGHKRLYSEADMRLIRVIATMRQMHIGLQTVRKTLPGLRRLINGDNPVPRFVMGVEYRNEIKFYFLNSVDEVVAALLRLQTQSKRFFLVSLEVATGEKKKARSKAA